MEHNNAELGYSPDVLAERQAELLDLLRQAVPEVISDNQIDIEKLKELIGEERVAPAEHYELTWAGKTAARREIQKATSHTLLPDASNPPHAPHMLIEGENLEVLRVLQKSYYGKVKMIYIDPPYNTGNDSFVYPDDYSETLDEYLKRTGEKSPEGYLNKQSLWKKNSKESGQYHSAWLSMMYPRLYLARNLLRDDGAIFVHIDEHEYANLEILLSEVFGEENNLGTIVWDKRNPKGEVAGVAQQHEFISVYAKNKFVFAKKSQLLRKKENARAMMDKVSSLVKKYGGVNDQVQSEFKKWIKENKDILSGGEAAYCHIDADGEIYQPVSMAAPDNPEKRSHRPLIHPVTNKPCPVPKKGWRYPDSTMDLLLSQNRIVFGNDESVQPRNKYLLKDNIFESLPSLLYFGGSDDALGTPFDNPKPVKVAKSLIASICGNEDIVLDFFAGSGTSAQAVMELNVEEGGNRQCICVQMPELLEESSEAYRAGYRTIADITRARIDKVINKLKAEHPEKTADLACAHFTLAPSNFKVWRGDVADEAALRESLNLFQSAEKNGHASKGADAQTAMLAELLLKHGLGALGVHAISKPVQLAGVTVHRVLMHDDKQMWLCFEPYTAALKDEIVKARPAQVVLLNSCFTGDKADELLSNLQLELAGLDIGLTVI